MKFESIDKVYACCGQYITPLKSFKGKSVKCPRCQATLTKTIECPHIVIVKN